MLVVIMAAGRAAADDSGRAPAARRDAGEGWLVVLINTDGMSFIGPGSEWFWTAATGVVAAVTLLAIYRQLRMQGAQGAIEQIDGFRRDAYSEPMARYALEVLVALRDHEDPADVPEAAVLGQGNFWGNFATLARAGHRDPALLWQSDSTTPQLIWWWIQPFVVRARTEGLLGVPSYEDLEWLVGVLAEMDRAAGRQAITPELVKANLDHMIRLNMDLIRYYEASRSTSSGSAATQRPAEL
jgi:hypothetical protein